MRTSTLFQAGAVMGLALTSIRASAQSVYTAYTFATIAGGGGGAGSADGMGSAARFAEPSGVAVDSADNVYVADSDNHTIRKVTPEGIVTTLAGLAGSKGSADGTGSMARFCYPGGVALDKAGNVYVADSLNETIRKMTPEGAVTTLAGLAGSLGSVDGKGSEARFNDPQGIGVDRAGNVYVADSADDTIRKVTPEGVVTTLVGMVNVSGSKNGKGSAARFGSMSGGPPGVAVDGAGNIYVADEANETIRKITPAGVVTTLAGVAGSQGTNDGPAKDARFHDPEGVTVDNSGTCMWQTLIITRYGKCRRRAS